MWCFFFLFFWVWKGLKTLTIVKVDYEQSLFHLSPSETRKTRKWPRACRFSRLFTARRLRAQLPSLNLKKERLLGRYRQRWITEDSTSLSLQRQSSHLLSLGRNRDKKFTGRGKMMVEFFSAEMVVNVCKYRSWRAEGDSEIMSAASFKARDAFISPSAAMTCNRWNIMMIFALERKSSSVKKEPENIQAWIQWEISVLVSFISVKPANVRMNEIVKSVSL